VDLTAQHARVLAALIEKAQTTPDGYPLSSNALRAACNQTSNRDPVVDYTEREIDALMLELREGGLARTVSGSGHRVGKHKHIVDEALGLDGHELAVLAVLLLRGPQTRNELTTRTERYTDGPAGDGTAVDAAIDRLASRPEPLVARLDRRPGEREPRTDQCWIPTDDRTDVAPGSHEAPGTAPPPPAHTPSEPAMTAPVHRDAASELAGRVAALESALAEQTRRLDDLLGQLGDPGGQ
jgi:uncharacterized protein YceH (UPF0502 family)